MDASNPSRVTLDRHLNAVYPAFALLAGVRLDVFTALTGRPMTVDDLARSLEVSAFELETLLHALVMAELLTVEDGGFANTAEADHYLVAGRPDYIGQKIAFYSERWAADLKTAESIRTGIPQGKLDFTGMSDAELTAFYNAGHAAAIAAGRLLAERYDLCRFESLMDVAGGSGGLAIEACRRCKELEATVIDLPTVTPITRRFVNEARMGGRIKVASLDVVNNMPEGRYDVAALANLIQVLTRDQARRALINVGSALAPRGVVFIVGWVLDNSQLSPPEIAASNFVFLNIYDEGRAYTEASYRAWLKEGGFTNFERTPLPGGESIITAEKAG